MNRTPMTTDPRIKTLAAEIAAELKAEGWTSAGDYVMTPDHSARLRRTLGVDPERWNGTANDPARRELDTWVRFELAGLLRQCGPIPDGLADD